MTNRPIDRRKMLQAGAALGVGTWVAPAIVPIDVVRAAVPSGTTFSFDAPSTEGWVIDNTAGPDGGGLWGLDNSQSVSAAHSLHYGTGAAGDYDTGAANSGTVTSPNVTVPASGDRALTMQVWREVETFTSGNWDQFQISVAPAGDVLYTRERDGGTSGLFELVTLDLSPYAGSTINIVLSFATGDGSFNNFEGIYVDDICFGSALTVAGAGAPAPTGFSAGPSRTGYFPNQTTPTQLELAERAAAGFEGRYPEYIELPTPGEKLAE